ncbi:MAG: hypothetical protein Q9219_003775 [cf. Caloplaca sp. 3 TL-2023]
MAATAPSLLATAQGSSSSNAERRRRAQNTSIATPDVSIEILPGMASDYTVEKYRVGIPSLQTLPLEDYEPDQSDCSVQRVRQLEGQIKQILQSMQIDYENEEDDPALVYRTIHGETRSDTQLTYLIKARWANEDDGQRWYNAAAAIRTLFLSHLATRAVKVEILSWHLTAEKIVAIIEPDHLLVPAWSLLRPQIIQIIDSFPKISAGWKSIDVIRMGYFSENGSPTPVTVSITVDWDLYQADWQYAESQIKTLLNAHNFFDVEVHFERGDLDPTISDL